MNYPYKSGDETVIGPQVILSADEKVINYRGENFCKPEEAKDEDVRSPNQG